jgi:hypothetical protein
MSLILSDVTDLEEVDDALSNVSDTIRRHPDSPRLFALQSLADDLLDLRLELLTPLNFEDAMAEKLKTEFPVVTDEITPDETTADLEPDVVEESVPVLASAGVPRYDYETGATVFE